MGGVQFDRRNAESIGAPKGGTETDDSMLSLRCHETSKGNVLKVISRSSMRFRRERWTERDSTGRTLGNVRSEKRILLLMIEGLDC